LARALGYSGRAMILLVSAIPDPADIAALAARAAALEWRDGAPPPGTRRALSNTTCKLR
jgi:hypothetical protein